MRHIQVTFGTHFGWFCNYLIFNVLQVGVEGVEAGF